MLPSQFYGESVWRDFAEQMLPFVPYNMGLCSVIECIVAHHRIHNVLPQNCKSLVLFGMDEILKIEVERQSEILNRLGALQQSLLFAFVPLVTSLSQDELEMRVATVSGRPLEVGASAFFSLSLKSLLSAN